LTDNYFLDLHLTDKSQVVGLLTETSAKTGQAQGQVIVEANGTPVGKHVQIVSVTGWSRSKSSLPNSSTDSNRSIPQNPSSVGESPLLQDHQQLWQYAGLALGALIILKALLSTLSGLLVFLLPAAYVYGVISCPAQASFDTKQQLKRVLRGHHLPESHPDKPKGFWAESLARMQAAVTTELVTASSAFLGGYDVTMIPLAGAAVVARVRVPSIEQELYWLGCNYEWYYVYSRSLATTTTTDTASTTYKATAFAKAATLRGKMH
jgi:hypothetical protein